MHAGEGRRLRLEVPLAALKLGGQNYAGEPPLVAITLDLSRTTGGGWSLRLRFSGAITGPCMRCLQPAAPVVAVDAREVDQPGGGEDLASPYVKGECLELADWARDAFALAAPDQILCRSGCLGLCPVCAEDLNVAAPGHGHEDTPDPRWAKLSELQLE